MSQARAEVGLYLQRYDEAEGIYREIDRKDLAVQMRRRVGDYMRVVQVAPSSLFFLLLLLLHVNLSFPHDCPCCPLHSPTLRILCPAAANRRWKRHSGSP